MFSGEQIKRISEVWVWPEEADLEFSWEAIGSEKEDRFFEKYSLGELWNYQKKTTFWKNGILFVN